MDSVKSDSHGDMLTFEHPVPKQLSYPLQYIQSTNDDESLQQTKHPHSFEHHSPLLTSDQVNGQEEISSFSSSHSSHNRSDSSTFSFNLSSTFGGASTNKALKFLDTRNSQHTTQSHDHDAPNATDSQYFSTKNSTLGQQRQSRSFTLPNAAYAHAEKSKLKVNPTKNDNNFVKSHKINTPPQPLEKVTSFNETSQTRPRFDDDMSDVSDLYSEASVETTQKPCLDWNLDTTLKDPIWKDAGRGQEGIQEALDMSLELSFLHSNQHSTGKNVTTPRGTTSNGTYSAHEKESSDHVAYSHPTSNSLDLNHTKNKYTNDAKKQPHSTMTSDSTQLRTSIQSQSVSRTTTDTTNFKSSTLSFVAATTASQSSHVQTNCKNSHFQNNLNASNTTKWATKTIGGSQCTLKPSHPPNVPSVENDNADVSPEYSMPFSSDIAVQSVRSADIQSNHTTDTSSVGDDRRSLWRHRNLSRTSGFNSSRQSNRSKPLDSVSQASQATSTNSAILRQKEYDAKVREKMRMQHDRKKAAQEAHKERSKSKAEADSLMSKLMRERPVGVPAQQLKDHVLQQFSEKQKDIETHEQARLRAAETEKREFEELRRLLLEEQRQKHNYVESASNYTPKHTENVVTSTDGKEPNNHRVVSPAKSYSHQSISSRSTGTSVRRRGEMTSAIRQWDALSQLSTFLNDNATEYDIDASVETSLPLKSNNNAFNQDVSSLQNHTASEQTRNKENSTRPSNYTHGSNSVIDHNSTRQTLVTSQRQSPSTQQRATDRRSRSSQKRRQEPTTQSKISQQPVSSSGGSSYMNKYHLERKTGMKDKHTVAAISANSSSRRDETTYTTSRPISVKNAPKKQNTHLVTETSILDRSDTNKISKNSQEKSLSDQHPTKLAEQQLEHSLAEIDKKLEQKRAKARAKRVEELQHRLYQRLELQENSQPSTAPQVSLNSIANDMLQQFTTQTTSDTSQKDSTSNVVHSSSLSDVVARTRALVSRISSRRSETKSLLSEEDANTTFSTNTSSTSGERTAYKSRPRISKPPLSYQMGSRRQGRSGIATKTNHTKNPRRIQNEKYDQCPQSMLVNQRPSSGSSTHSRPNSGSSLRLAGAFSLQTNTQPPHVTQEDSSTRKNTCNVRVNRNAAKVLFGL